MLRHLNNNRIIWQTDDGLSGSLSKQVTVEMISWRQRRFYSREAGGVLLGFIDAESDGILVERCTIPGKKDKRSRCSFYRGPRHQLEADEWHQKTGWRGTQLGLWHTHPEQIPTPSSIDVNDYQSVLQFGKYPAKALLFLIVGIKETAFWIGQKNKSLLHIGNLEL